MYALIQTITFCLVPDSSPTQTAQAMSSTSISVHWNEVPFIHQNGIIITYEVLYEPLDSYDGQLEGQSMNVTSLSTVLTGLEEFTEYNISVRAYTVVGAGPYSDNITINTFQDSMYTACTHFVHATCIPYYLSYRTSYCSQECHCQYPIS